MAENTVCGRIDCSYMAANDADFEAKAADIIGRQAAEHDGVSSSLSSLRCRQWHTYFPLGSHHFPGFRGIAPFRRIAFGSSLQHR